MRSKDSSKEKASARLTDKVIYIIGPRRLQNELMASFLERETGAKCKEAEDVSYIPAIHKKDTAQSRLILWDCQGKDPDGCLIELESGSKNILSQYFLALINVNYDRGIEEKSLSRGVRGFFYEKDPSMLLPKGVRAIFNGELWAPREIMAKYIMENRGKKETVPKKDVKILTSREIEILTMVVAGVKNREIASELFISPNTVKTHIYNIFKKIDVPNRLQAALWAAKNL